ncbi:SDR family NAD(P)-dependent oxidoreductase [Microbispora sp. H13382]|uniref:SDR family NAD(P)-dependent oxidoreductase n=1 Tax=Microbispora sp. H13382 TaxID=2729112 RepID=UPI002873D484|nr:SDR family NAD(P)-dependent oxidoreductase [Microbispora sp. H13382]
MPTATPAAAAMSSIPASGLNAWTHEDIPGQRGRTAVVTGANTGIGFETAKALALRGATVVLACRDLAKAETAAGGIRRDAPRATVDVVRLDLLLTVPGSRVVTVSSIGHRFGRIDTDAPDSGAGAYARSKLANLLFAYELQRRLRASGAPTAALAAHPGGAATEVFRYSSPWFRVPNLLIARLFGRTPAMGALPTLRAATDHEAVGGDYYGPGGLFEIRGHPERVRAAARAHDSGLGQRLWEVSQRLTSVTYPV